MRGIPGYLLKDKIRGKVWGKAHLFRGGVEGDGMRSVYVEGELRGSKSFSWVPSLAFVPVPESY